MEIVQFVGGGTQTDRTFVIPFPNLLP